MLDIIVNTADISYDLITLVLNFFCQPGHIRILCIKDGVTVCICERSMCKQSNHSVKQTRCGVLHYLASVNRVMSQIVSKIVAPADKGKGCFGSNNTVILIIYKHALIQVMDNLS